MSDPGLITLDSSLIIGKEGDTETLMGNRNTGVSDRGDRVSGRFLVGDGDKGKVWIMTVSTCDAIIDVNIAPNASVHSIDSHVPLTSDIIRIKTVPATSTLSHERSSAFVTRQPRTYCLTSGAPLKYPIKFDLHPKGSP